VRGHERDLVVLVADGNMRAAVGGVLSRPKALRMRPLHPEPDIFVHIYRDPGCYRSAHDFLRHMAARSAHALVLFDRHGSGQEARSREDIEAEVEERLSRAGWGDRALAVVLDPELENWMWSDSPQVDQCLGWASREPPLRSWLAANHLWPEGAVKPPDPKDAVERVLREVRQPRSSSIYRRLAEHVSLQRCGDPAFHKFRDALRGWFPPERETL